ncbi:MAG: hypothetical protein JO110_18185 [Acetobacteraceae bacterium]|nr:hypothetical protein [Acetobacteraceae bacterium]
MLSKDEASRRCSNRVDTTVGNLFGNAKSYLAAADRIIEGGELDLILNPAFYLLIGFTLELLLKAICLDAGATQTELRMVIGHDLHMAYRFAMERGRVPRVMTEFGKLVLALRDHHKEFVFRYTPDIPELVVPPPAYCVSVIKENLPWIERSILTPIT